MSLGDAVHRRRQGVASLPPLVRRLTLRWPTGLAEGNGEAVAHCYLGHGRAWRLACGDDLALQLCIVTSANGRLGV